MVFQELIFYLNSPEAQGFILPFKIIFIFLSIVFAFAVSYFIHKSPEDFLAKKETAFNFFSYNGFKKKSDSKFRKKWNNIRRFLKNDIEAEHKIAVIEAYALFSEFLAGKDWTGENLAAQIDLAKESDDFMFNRENLLLLSNLRENIVADKNYKIGIKEVKSLFADLENDIQAAEK